MSELHSKPPIITLTTDFGTKDWFVGTMKGVIASIEPKASIIDITHSISPGHIREGAFVLKQAIPWFPTGTIHVGVVDPGVGTSRKAMIVETEKGYFIGPDNGLFSWALKDDEVKSIVELHPEKIGPYISTTFHGRDLFAPIAALLASGQPPTKYGQSRREMIRLDWPEWSMSGTRIEGEILHEDRFGNLITNLPATSFLNDTKALQIWLTNDTQPTQVEIHTTYGHGPDGTFALITGSTGYLEWAIKNGNAAKVTGWKAGDHFQLTRLPMV